MVGNLTPAVKPFLVLDGEQYQCLFVLETLLLISPNHVSAPSFIPTDISSVVFKVE